MSSNALTVLALLTTASHVHGQALSLVSISPAANTNAAVRTNGVVASFSQPLTAASAAALRVFSSQRGGLRSQGGAAVMGANLEFFPTAYPFMPGETVQVTVTRAAASSAGVLARPWVGQFTTAVSRTGTGLFQLGSDVPVGIQPRSVAVADVDGDGDLDMLVGSFNQRGVSVRLNDGTGTFGGTQQVYAAGGPVGGT